MPRTLKLIGLAALCGVFAIACGDDAIDEIPSSGDPPPPSLVGVWVFQSASIDGASTDLANVLDWAPGTAAAELHILENGAFEYREVDGNGWQLSVESGFVVLHDAHELDLVFGPDDGVTRQTLTFRLVSSGERLELREVASTLVLTLARELGG